MSPEAQNKSIGEFVGWTRLNGYSDYWLPPGIPFLPETEHRKRLLPDFVTDLNAMHEAEQHLGNLLHGYWHNLWDLCEPKFPFAQTRTHFDYADFDKICTATAAQRAEALLKAIGRWIEEGKE